VPIARPDSAAELGKEPVESVDPSTDAAAKSDGASAEKSDRTSPNTDNGKSGGIAGATDKKPAEARPATGAGTEANTDAKESAEAASPSSTKDSTEETRSTDNESESNQAKNTSASDATAASSDPSSRATDRVGSADITTAEDIEIPIFEIEERNADGTLLEEAQVAQHGRTHPISGIWEQIEGPNSSDFAPGGYQRSIIALNPANKTVTVYRLFRGDVAMVVGGELALDCEANPASRTAGDLSIRTDPSLHSKFRTAPLPLGGSPSVTMEPPAGVGPWPYAWQRERVELVLGDKRYAAITREAFDKVRSGGNDVATAADQSERIPDRKPGARGISMKETSFFGVRGGGKRICFVVDMSGSMAGPKFDRLKQELTQTIQGFEKSQLFSVAFFHGMAEVIDQSWMQADRDGARATHLITQQGLGGGTDPTDAFIFAFQTLSPIPDCVYFMTDGQIPSETPKLLRSLNVGKNRTIIHTINFGEPASEGIMKQIAQEHSGTYTFVQP